MNNRKNIKHTLKTDIDYADTWIRLALIGTKYNMPNSAESGESLSKSREAIISELTNLKQKILDGTNNFIAEIDSAIEKLS